MRFQRIRASTPMTLAALEVDLPAGMQLRAASADGRSQRVSRVDTSEVALVPSMSAA